MLAWLSANPTPGWWRMCEAKSVKRISEVLLDLVQALRVGACSSAVPLGSTDLGVEHMYMRLHTLRAQVCALHA
jgi:hypothetical protein